MQTPLRVKDGGIGDAKLGKRYQRLSKNFGNITGNAAT